MSKLALCTILYFRRGTDYRFPNLHVGERLFGTVGSVLEKLRRDAASVLLKMAKATRDPKVAGAMVEKAADIKDKLDANGPAGSPAVPPNAMGDR